MTDVPDYFEAVRVRAAKRWDQLEQDPELAGPWHQLFKQVQSPRHVLSELLQNADDARATKAFVDIEDGDFIFMHDGEDFTEEHFMSLCRFGYSNKRALHTIGFRGIGFKSTFSIGDTVRLNTPTLSVAFCRERFTEPVWQKRDETPGPYTEIRVAIRDDHRRRELEKNLADWTKSSSSLLFFKSIRCLTICGQEIRWQATASGPVDSSQWMALSSDPIQQFLLIQSATEDFPDEALEEIRQERMVGLDEEGSFPPCKIEIVLGLEGRLFVILPTGVKTKLPFACNAPFIQDPGRLKIKDPEISPTNRWLLERAGTLAAKTMMDWLHHSDFDIKLRCQAYALLPDVDRDDHSIEGSCGRLVEEACENVLQDQAYLITENGTLEKEKGCIAVPEVLLDIWSPDQVQRLFGRGGLPILSRLIESKDRCKLVNWNCFDEVAKESVLDTLKSKHLPKPASWAQLLLLWAYVADDVIGYHYYRNDKNVRILPVQGKDVLFATNEIVRLGEKKLLQSQEDWQFLSEYLLVLNQNWLRYLAEQRRRAEQEKIEALGRQVESAYNVIYALYLSHPGDEIQVIPNVSEKFFSKEKCGMEDCIRLAQLAATLGVSVSENFQFVTRDGYRKPVNRHIVYDIHNDVDVFVPDQWHKEHVLHEDYRVLLSCTEEDWQQWVLSGRSGLLTFAPLVPTQDRIWGRDKLQKLLQERDYNNQPSYPYVTIEFILDDWDFEENHWNHWKLLQAEDGDFWGRLFTRLLDQPKQYWFNAISAKVSQIATTRTKQRITHEPVSPSWIVKFRELPCLQDTRGHYRLPEELLCRTPDTEPFLDIEPFVRAELDVEANRQLLVMLGVRNTPTGPNRLLERLQTLATVENPPVYEVEKWCNRLDQILAKCSSDEFQLIKKTFIHQKVILTAECEWVCAPEVFLNADEEDAPGAAVVHPSLRNLSLWHKVGVAARPTGDLSLKWLAGIPSNKKLSKDELRRVRALLPRYPERIWSQCGHWLNLESEWAPVAQLSYKLTMQTLIPWVNLFRPIKQKTADLQKLTVEICERHPFVQLKTLASCIEDRFDNKIVESGTALVKPWIVALGSGLGRVELDDETENQRMRELGHFLSQTKFQTVTALETTPYIDGVPSGTARRIDVLWKDMTLYVENKSMAKMAIDIAHELGRHFGRNDVTDAIKLCFERDPEFVTEYLEENFKLLPPQEDGAETHDPAIQDEQISKSSDRTKEGKEKAAVCGNCTDSDSPPHDKDTSEEMTQDVIAPDGLEGIHPSDGDRFGDDEIPHARRDRIPRPSKPKLIERFAASHGFSKDSSEGRYYHKDGGWLERTTGVSFPWERYSASGELIQCYWVKDHCIEREPLQLEAEVWDLCVKHPEKYTLLLVALDGSPLEYSGKQICDLRDGGRLTLFPASYRIVYDHNAQPERDEEKVKGGG